MPMATPEEQREYQRLWMARRRQRGIEFLGGVCVVCGTREELEIDHIDPATKDMLLRKNSTSSMWSWSWKRIETELLKCQLLCHKHHLEKSIRNKEISYALRGKDHVNAKFTVAQVLEIRASMLPTSELARQYGVYTATISKIRKGQRWRSVPP